MDTIQEAIEFLSLMEEPEYVSEIVALRARVPELERERDQLALSLSAARAERDHAVRSAELLEDEYNNERAVTLAYRHAYLEGRAIMAVCLYFGRMRSPDAWQYRLPGRMWSECRHRDLNGIAAFNDANPDDPQFETRPLYAGSAPVPAVDDDALLDMARQLVAAEEELAEMTERKDAAYFERNQVVAALAKCFPSIVTQTEIPGWSPEWHGCVYIQLPTGQVSWHFHESQEYLFAELPRKGAGWDGWDGHDTDEKYRRVNSIPVPAVPQAVDVDAICNAYESGVGHRGRPTALINPYPAYSVEAFAYSLGANGIDAAIAKHKEGSSNE